MNRNWFNNNLKKSTGCFWLFLIVLSINGKAQTINSTFGKNYHNINNDVLKRFILISFQNNFHLDTIFIDQNDQAYSIDDIVSKVGNIDVETADWSVASSKIDAIKEQCQKYSRNFLKISISPLYYNKGQFELYVNIEDVVKKYPAKKYHLENGVVFYYDYNSGKKSFAFSHYKYPKIITGQAESNSSLSNPN